MQSQGYRKEKKEKEKSLLEIFTAVSKTGALTHEFQRQIMSADLYSVERRESSGIWLDETGMLVMVL